MLRVVIGLGVLLMTVGFGAAGWQYWSSLPPAADQADLAAAAPLAPGQGGWLVSPTGGLLPVAELRGYLAQDRFVPARLATVTTSATLTDLLEDGESLPTAAYLQVFADIRAPKVAGGLCAALLSAGMQECALHSARVVPGSVDAVRGIARFEGVFAYRLPPEDAPMPPLGDRVFQTETLAIGAQGAAPAEAEADPGQAAPLAGSAAEALSQAIAAGREACAADTTREACRIMDLTVDWSPGSPTGGQVRIGWLSALPEGVFPAPSLDVTTDAPQG